MKLVHAADLHIDSPLSGLTRYGGAPVELIRGATRRALQNLVSLCEQEQVALLLLAGDLFDGDWRDYTTGLFFAEQMARLKRAGVEVALIRGNHDAASQITKHLTLPDNVTELSFDAPETRQYPHLGIAVHGQSYARRAETEDLAKNYPEPISGLLNIGLLHTCVTGRVGHEPYAPCRLETLIAKGYDYWALGHVHQREVLSSEPWVVFSGNLQGRHIKELGPKGATLIEVAEGRIRSVEHRELDVVRWAQARVQVPAEADADLAVECAALELERLLSEADGRALIVRVTLEGQTEAHAALEADQARWEAELRARASESSRVWVESVRFGTQPLLSFERLRQRGDALGQLARSIDELRREPAQLGEFLPQFEDLKNKLPLEARQGPGALKLDEVDTLASVLDEVESLLLTRLAALGQSS